MLTTKEAIHQRRSIRRFKRDSFPEDDLMEILDAARLAPSGCNAQPWRFKIVRDGETKLRLAKAAFNQMFVANAPVIVMCCADVRGYLDGSMSGVQDLGKITAIEDRIAKILVKRTGDMESLPVEQIGILVALNVAIAVEHMVLRALDFGLGTCWVRLFDVPMIKEIFQWDDNIFPVAMLPIGYPDEDPQPRPRLSLKELILE
ncbi:nitroreductase [Desulfatibacillum aliphaticivorans]|uniref:Nitroreductase n=1 Tax=Desulfatibacillum aliphaticivorans TaxID=218208 RepID=B8FHT9_DESAL|nr:nitroreductase family protein [Desulfatibacillum aliphaticivorans]ACL02506.1 nitroreductase [Desulfatibacillum aliphaticivorans]